MNCPPKDDKTISILVVADGGLHFEESDDGLGLALGQVKGARCGANSDWRFQIETLNRSEEKLEEKDLCSFDELWLFGAAESSAWDLPEKGRRAIENLMQRGGGIFATGDHWEVGRPLNGEIHKIRWMRHWYPGDAPKDGLDNSPGRAETAQPTVWPVPITSLTGGGEWDKVAKLVWPVLFRNSLKQATAHPVFDRKNGRVIRRLPDHMHEGLSAAYSTWDDLSIPAQGDFLGCYPDSKERCHPITIAWGLRGKVDFAPKVLHSKPEPYAVACAYDAHRLEIEQTRILTDSSFYHWLYQNVKPLRRSARKDVKAYYRNIARWLIPREKQLTILLAELRALMFDPQFFPNRRDPESSSPELLGARISERWIQQIGAGWADESKSAVLRQLTPTLATNRTAIVKLAAAADVGIDLGNLALGILGKHVGDLDEFPRPLEQMDWTSIAKQFNIAMSACVNQRSSVIDGLRTLFHS